MTWLIGLVIFASSIAFAWLVLSWWHLRCGSSTGTTGRRRRQIRRADRAKDVAFADDATDSPSPVVTHWSRNADNGRLAAHYSCEPPGHLPGRQLQGAPSAERREPSHIRAADMPSKREMRWLEVWLEQVAKQEQHR